MKKILFPTGSIVLLMFMFVVSNCRKEPTAPTTPVQLQTDEAANSRCFCPVEFTASDLLIVCGTLTNNDACGVCNNPNIGKLKGVEKISTGTFLVACDKGLQFTNASPFPITIKIKDANNVVTGYEIPAGRILVAGFDSTCGITATLCP